MKSEKNLAQIGIWNKTKFMLLITKAKNNIGVINKKYKKYSFAYTYINIKKQPERIIIRCGVKSIFKILISFRMLFLSMKI